MANPNYGNTFNEALPTPYLNLYGDTGAGDFQGVKVGETNNVYFQISGQSSYKVRIAYQKRMRLAAGSSWAGGEQWTGWQSEAGVADAWTQLYTTADTALETIIRSDGEKATVKSLGSFSYNVSTYDKIEYRVQAWIVDLSTASNIKYGRATSKILSVTYEPDFEVVSAVIDPATMSLAITLSPNWPRGYQFARITKLQAGDVVVSKSIQQTDSLVFTYEASDVAELIEAGSSIAVTALVYGAQTTGAKSYTKTKAMSVSPASGSVTVPTAVISEQGFDLEFTVANHSYTRVDVTASWEGGSETFPLAPSGANWIGLFSPPFGVPVTYTVAGYNRVGAVESFNYSTISKTFSADGFALSYGDLLVWIDLEAKEKQSVSPEEEVITLASGRAIARHGKGKERNITLTGELLGVRHGGHETQWLSDIEVLKEPHDWVYRNIYGERFNVVVSQFQRNPQGVFDVVQVSISMTEVE